MQNFDSAKIGLAATKVKDALAIAMERLEINDYGGEEAEHLEAVADGEAAFRNDIVPILTEAPAMLAALRQVVDLAELHIAERSSSPEEESEFLACAYLLNARAILARIDATPTAPFPAPSLDPDPDQWPGGDLTGHPGYDPAPTDGER